MAMYFECFFVYNIYIREKFGVMVILIEIVINIPSIQSNVHEQFLRSRMARDIKNYLHIVLLERNDRIFAVIPSSSQIA